MSGFKAWTDDIENLKMGAYESASVTSQPKLSLFEPGNEKIFRNLSKADTHFTKS